VQRVLEEIGVTGEELVKELTGPIA